MNIDTGEFVREDRRAYMRSPQFAEDCRRLQAEGYEQREIAGLLGVSQRSVGRRISGDIPFHHRFWKKVDKRGPDECWEWQGGKGGKGYGRIVTPGGGRITATLASLWIHCGPTPTTVEGQPAMVCHTCDNPGCVNPAHLYLGNAKTNSRDCSARGRQVGNRRLTDQEYREIIASRETPKRLAPKYGVAPCSISNIRAGRVKAASRAVTS